MSTTTMTESRVSGNGRAQRAAITIERSELDDFRARLAKLGYKADGSAKGTPLPLANNGGAPGQVGSVWMEVTPALAGEWLKFNFRNRPVREDVVKAYARDMLNGVWVATHQGVAFNDQNLLIDGQHRLKAIVMAGVTVRMMVTVGLPTKIEGPAREMTTMDAVDRGATRSVADQLKIQHGLKNGASIAMICTQLAGLCYESRTRRMSVEQTLEVYRAFEPAVNYVIEHRSKEAGLRTVGVLAGFAFALTSEDAAGHKYWEGKTAISEMFAELNSGKGSKKVLKKLREFLTGEEAKLFTRALNRGLTELVLQAIWLEQKGWGPEKLHGGVDGANHFRKLQGERVGMVAALFKLKNERELAAEVRE